MSYDLALDGDDFGDDFGDDDIEGDDFGSDVDLIMGGAARPAKRRIRVKRIQPGKQTQVLPFPRTSVAAGVTATITAFPQRPFQTERLVWGSTVAASFTIDELKVGQETMMVQTGSVPAEVFSQLGVHVSLRGYIARPGVTISMTCTNTSAGALFTSAAIIGAALI